MKVSLDIDEERLKALGVDDPAQFAREAFDERLTELEDARIARDRLADPEGFVSQAELEAELGLGH